MTETVPEPVPFKYNAQYFKTFQTTNIAQTTQIAQLSTSFRTATPSTAMTGTTTTKQVNPVHVHQDTSCKAPLGHCAHVHKSTA